MHCIVFCLKNTDNGYYATHRREYDALSALEQTKLTLSPLLRNVAVYGPWLVYDITVVFGPIKQRVRNLHFFYIKHDVLRTFDMLKDCS